MFSPEQVLRDLAALRVSDPDCKRFGARAHRYRLNAVLGEADLAAVEARHRIALPADFRLFLGRVGNGGAGPGYGLSRWGEENEGHQVRPWGPEHDLSKPFPHRKAWTGSGYLDEPVREEYDDIEEYERVHARWADPETRLNDYWEAAALDFGNVRLCHYGCGQWAFLVVNGPCAGEVWRDLSSDGMGVKPIDLDGRRATFGAWYIDWLHRRD
jgi:hypothetical protein